MIRIESNDWRLWCNPDRGVEWLAAEVRQADHWYAVVPDCRQHGPLPAASFHMLPYSNRIRDGQFVFQGRTVVLAEGDSHAIHGAVQKLPWRIESQNSRSLTCSISSADHPAMNWPWPIRAVLSHRIDADRLTSTLQVTNQGDSDMPAGLGWHPYFERFVNGCEPALTLPVDALFPDANGDCLPDGPAGAIPALLDFRSPRKLDASQHIDCCLAGLHGSCVIDWGGAGIKLIMSASEACRYLVLYNPDQPYFAVEPVTNANDAFNLAAQGIESGMQVLAPGASLKATMVLQAVIA